MKQMSANKALCLNNLMILNNNSQRSTPQTNKHSGEDVLQVWQWQVTCSTETVRTANLKWRLHQYLTTLFSKGLMTAPINSANKHISLQAPPWAMVLLPFSIKYHVNFTPPPSPVRTVLVWIYCTYVCAYIIESCKVKMSQKIKENLETMFYKQCMLHHDAKCGRGESRVGDLCGLKAKKYKRRDTKET